MLEVLPSAISSAQSTIECDKEVASFLDANRDEIRRKLNKELPELGYYGKYRLLAGFDEDFPVAQGTKYNEVFLVLDGDLEYDEETISKALYPIFAPHATMLYMKSHAYNLIYPAELEDSDSDDLSSAGQPQPTHVIQASSYDLTLQATVISSEPGNGGLQIPVPVEYKPELKVSFDPQLLVETKRGNLDDQSTFGMKLEMTIKLSNNESREDRIDGIPDWIISKGPWYTLDFDELTIWSKNNEQFSVSALHLRIEATPFTTGCDILAPDSKNPTIYEDQHYDRALVEGTGVGHFAEVDSGNAVQREPYFDQWTIHTISYKRSGARVVEVDYADDTTRASCSVTPPLRLGEEHLPRVFFSSYPTDSGRSLRVTVKTFWTSNSTKNTNFELRQTPIMLSNFWHQTSFEIDLDDLMRNKEFGKKNIPLAPFAYPVIEAIEDAIDEAKQQTDAL